MSNRSSAAFYSPRCLWQIVGLYRRASCGTPRPKALDQRAWGDSTSRTTLFLVQDAFDLLHSFIPATHPRPLPRRPSSVHYNPSRWLLQKVASPGRTSPSVSLLPLLPIIRGASIPRRGFRAVYRGADLTGATMNMFEVTTLGQPLEVLKTQMAANRSQSMGQAFRAVWGRGGVLGFYQGLIPWVSCRSARTTVELTVRPGLRHPQRVVCSSLPRLKSRATRKRSLVSVMRRLVCWEVSVVV